MAARPSQRALRSLSSIYGQSSAAQKYTCHSCRNALRQQAALTQSTTLTRQFTTAPSLLKKSSGSAKSNRKSPVIPSSKNENHIPNNKHSANIDAEPDAYDYTELQASIDTAIARLKDALSKTRDAGRVTAEMVEALPVELNVKGSNTEGGSAHKSKTKIGDLASVVPKGGRIMQVFAAEEAHLKPLTTSIQSSPYSLTPQPDANNPLLLLIPVPPATTETRKQAAEEAKKSFEKANLEVRNARGDAQKRFRKMELQKLVVPDELKKAHKGMEDVVKKGTEEVKRVFEAGVKAVLQG